MSKEFKRIGKRGVVFPKDFDWPRAPFVLLDCSGSEIIIEKEVTFSSGVYVLTHNHYFYKSNWRTLPTIKNDKPTVFKKGCFIGINSIILHKCKKIGEYSVVAAGSVVTRSIAPYEMWAGNPAKKIGDVKKV